MNIKKGQFDYSKYGKLALFAELDSAYENSDFNKAALAQSELKKLGVIVKFKEKVAQSERSLEEEDG